MQSIETNIGIDRIAFYTPNFYLDLKDLAVSRNIDPNKFVYGLGQIKMSVIPADEDIVTMAAAAIDRLKLDSYDDIDWLVVATESATDYSKSAALYVHKLLNMPTNIKVIEMKQACSAGTAALDFALAYVNSYPTKKVLIVNSDYSRYGLNSAGESSQGAAAVSLLIARDPAIMNIEPVFGTYSEEIMDFWRPSYLNEALVDGKYSCMVYLSFLEKSYQEYVRLGGKPADQLNAYCFHTPFPKLVQKAYKYVSNLHKNTKLYPLELSINYTSLIGNCYTGSLFLSLISLLDSQVVADGSRIGMYSYGSGSTAIFFSGILQEDYYNIIDSLASIALIENRIKLDVNEYEKIYNFQLPQDGSLVNTPKLSNNRFRLTGINRHKRLYSAS